MTFVDVITHPYSSPNKNFPVLLYHSYFYRSKLRGMNPPKIQRPGREYFEFPHNTEGVMIMIIYHGSSVGGLTELKPFSKPWSNLKQPLVYMTSSKQLAAHYIWPTEKYEIKSPMLDIRPDGTLVFQEMFSGALEYFYKGLNGWIYQCDGDYEYLRCDISDICEVILDDESPPDKP